MELFLWLKEMVSTTRSDISYRGMEDIGTIERRYSDERKKIFEQPIDAPSFVGRLVAVI